MSPVWQFVWDDLPPGFRFHPTDEELVIHYLLKYVHGIKDDVDVIPIVDDLFKQEPSELPGLFRGSSIIRSKDPEWWFLSTLRCKPPHADKFDRRTRTGNWKITGNPKKIHNRREKRVVAEMRNLVFCENRRSKETNWVIHEYYLKDSSLGLLFVEQRKYVLCHLVNRQYDDYTDMPTNMEVDLESRHGFSEEIIQAKIISLTEGSPSPARCEPVVNPVDEMEHVMSTSGVENDYMTDLLNEIDFDSAPIDGFDVMALYEQLGGTEETVLSAKQNRQARPPGALEGYVVVEESEGFVEATSTWTTTAGRKGNQTGDGCRTPIDYLVNLVAGTLLFVLMILHLLSY